MTESTHSIVGGDVSPARRAHFARWKLKNTIAELNEMELKMKILCSQIEEMETFRQTWKNRLKESTKIQSQRELQELTSQIQNRLPQEIRDIIYSKYLSSMDSIYVQKALYTHHGLAKHDSNKISQKFVLLDPEYSSKDVVYEVALILFRRCDWAFGMKHFEQSPMILRMKWFLNTGFFNIGLKPSQCVRSFSVEFDGYLIRDESKELKRNLTGLLACCGHNGLTISILILQGARIREIVAILRFLKPIHAQLVASGVRIRFRYYRDRSLGSGERDCVFSLPCGPDCLDLNDIFILSPHEWPADIVERIGYDNLYRKEQYWFNGAKRRQKAKRKQRELAKIWNIWADDLLLDDEGLTMRHYNGVDLWETYVDEWLVRDEVYNIWLDDFIGLD